MRIEINTGTIDNPIWTLVGELKAISASGQAAASDAPKWKVIMKKTDAGRRYVFQKPKTEAN